MLELLNGDCLRLLPTIKSKSVDLVLADLPYGLTSNKWDCELDLDLLWGEYKRIIKCNGVVALTASMPFTATLVVSNLSWFRHEWIWIKNKGSNFANTIREPFKEHESVLIFSPGKWTYNKQMQERSEAGKKLIGKTITACKNHNRANMRPNIKDANRVLSEFRVPSSFQKFNCERGLHPTQKPVGLMEYLIRTYTNVGGTVLDNCMGSGSTGVAAMNLGRRFIGIEKDSEYFHTAKSRIESSADSDLFALLD